LDYKNIQKLKSLYFWSFIDVQLRMKIKFIFLFSWFLCPGITSFTQRKTLGKMLCLDIKFFSNLLCTLKPAKLLKVQRLFPPQTLFFFQP